MMVRRALTWTLAGWLPAAWVAAEDIRDIRGPATAGGAPPFTLTIAVLALAGGAALFSRTRRRRPRTDAGGESAASPMDQLSALAREHAEGVCPDDLLFERLDALLRRWLARGDAGRAGAMTLSELASSAQPPLDITEKAALDAMLPIMERVRFATARPGATDIARVLEAASHLIGRGADGK